MGCKIKYITFLSREKNFVLQKMILWKEGFNMAKIIITSNKFILRSTGFKNVFLFINSEQNIKFNAKNCFN